MAQLPVEQAVQDLENKKRDRLPVVSDLAAQSVTATGSSASDAAEINATLVLITTAGSGSGVKLPLAYEGSFICIRNSGANAATVYCQTNETVDGSASTTIAASTSKMFFAPSPTTWFTI